MVLLVSLNYVVINHQKGEIESAFGPLSGFGVDDMRN
jgi:hypothetical protein